MDDDLPGAEGAHLGQSAHQAGQRLVGHGEEDEVDVLDDLRHVKDRYARKEVGGPRPGLLAHRGDRGHLVAGAMERGAQDRADPARADDAHREPRRVVLVLEPSCALTTDEPTPAGWAGERAGAVAGGVAARALRPDGFYRRAAGPAAHFTTATHGGPGRALARTLWAWADRFGLDGIVDVGAGRGELLRHLYAGAPGRPLTGLDVVPRPPTCRRRWGGWRRRADPTCPRTGGQGGPSSSRTSGSTWCRARSPRSPPTAPCARSSSTPPPVRALNRMQFRLRHHERIAGTAH